MRHLRSFLLFISYLTVMHSCILEDPWDPSECPPPYTSGITLSYDYLLNMDYTNRFDRQVSELKAFIFNADGILCDTLTPPVVAGELNNEWVRQINLDPGTYSIVTWAGNLNFRQSYLFAHQNDPSEPNAEGVIIGQTRITDLRTFLRYNIQSPNNHEATPVQNNFHELFYGIQRDIVVKEKEHTTVHTSLLKDSKTIRVKIGQLSAISTPAPIASDFNIRLTGRNGHYLSDNNTGEQSHLIRYVPHTQIVEEDTLRADIKTLRLRKYNQDDPYAAPLALTITQRSTGMKICESLDVVDLVLKSHIPFRDNEGRIQTDDEGKTIWVYPTLEYLDRQDLFEIIFAIKHTGGGGDDGDGQLNFTVYVNGWKIANIIPDI